MSGIGLLADSRSYLLMEPLPFLGTAQQEWFILSYKKSEVDHAAGKLKMDFKRLASTLFWEKSTTAFDISLLALFTNIEALSFLTKLLLQ